MTANSPRHTTLKDMWTSILISTELYPCTSEALDRFRHTAKCTDHANAAVSVSALHRNNDVNQGIQTCSSLDADVLGIVPDILAYRIKIAPNVGDALRYPI